MQTEGISLSRLSMGRTMRVQSVGGALRARLMDIGLVPGTAVTCVHRSRGIAAYRIRGAVIALRDTDAGSVLLI